MLKQTVLAAALALAATPALASHHDAACDVHSAYDLKVTSEALDFTKSAGNPRDVRMQAGRLYVDGREVALSAADRDRVARYEAEVRALIPEVKAIAREAVGIAFSAIVEVARTFADSDDDFARSRAKLDDARRGLDQRIEAEFDSRAFDDVAFEHVIEDAVKTTVPVIVGEVTGKAVRIALSGDERAAEALERKAGEMEKTLEREVERKADALEARAKALCPRIVALDRIEADLTIRVDGQPLDLIHTR